MPRRSTSSPSNSPNSRPPKRSRRSVASDRELRDKALAADGVILGRRVVLAREDFLENSIALKDYHTKGHEDTALKAESVDLHIPDNRKEHRTEEYEHEELIVRRGQTFRLSVTFNRAYNKSQDSIILQFATDWRSRSGNRPQESKGNLLRVKVGEKTTASVNRWTASIEKSDDTKTTVSVSPSADAIVGKYHLYVDCTTTFIDEDESQHRHEFQDQLFVLFNPWCEDDDVYMDNDKERNEYVMNETGRIWMGTVKNYEGLPWVFGQFEDVSLNTALYLLDKAELTDGARCNPILIIRALSALINCMDDRGLLEGRWTETFPKSCIKPWEWTGSVEILEQFWKKKKTVKYGQCWVFSGIATTLTRALGIPSRSVTTFESAHDTDASMTIDMHWTIDDEPVEDINDSIWNFHVWNEAFFKRPDLPSGYDGWQAFDGTPQEASEGVMRCGPAPVKAIRDGSVYLPYDAPFIFAEVNGDKVHWLLKEDGSMEPIYKETDIIGLKISTKAVGYNRRNDITDEYKHDEGTDAERAVVKQVFRYSKRREYDVYNIEEPDVKFELQTPESVQIGHDVDLKVKLRNKTDEERNVTFRLCGVVSYYTGVPSERIFSKSFTDKLGASEEKEETVHVSYDDYKAFIKPEAAIQVYLKGTVKETKRNYAHTETFSFTKPALKLVVNPTEVVIGEEFELSISFTNPLHDELTGGHFHIEAPGIVKSLVIDCKKAIGAGEECRETTTLTARRSGSKEIVASFSADNLAGVTGTTEIYVKYSS